MRRTAKILAAVAVIATASGTTVSQASFFSFPLMLKRDLQLDQISLAGPVLAPMAHVRFCLRYEDDCDVHGVDFRKRHIALTVERWNELNTINRQVNRRIIPQAHFGDVASDQWYVAPSAGDCADYAVTKRHELLARGWPSRALLLAEVVVPDGEHHLVLVVRMKTVDLVLDNLNANIRTVAMTRRQYRWVRVESPYNPKFWAAVIVPAPTLPMPDPVRRLMPAPLQVAMLID